MTGLKPYPDLTTIELGWTHSVPDSWRVLPCRGIVVEKIKKNEGSLEENYLSLMAKVGVIPYEEKGDVGNKKPDDLTKCKLVKKGDLVINSMNYGIGSYGLSSLDGVCSPVYIVLRPIENIVHERYALRIFESKLFQKYAQSFGTGILEHRAAIGWDDLKNIKVGIPTLAEQSTILGYLDQETSRIDTLIQKKNCFIELLREKRQAIITHAVTKGLNPNAPMKDSGIEWLGEMPEHWNVCRLKFLAEIQTGVAKGKDLTGKETLEVPYLRVANVQDGYLALDDIATIEIEQTELGRYSLQPGDVLMNEGGDYDKLGRGHVWSGEISPCIHQNHVFAVRPHAVSSFWLNAFSSSQPAQFYFMSKSKQSTNLASISSSNLMELPVPMPPENEQSQILDRLERDLAVINMTIKNIERSIALLNEKRSALITAAVTGQIDLRGAA